MSKIIDRLISIIKAENEEQRLCYGVVYEPMVEDAHGDYATEYEIQKAAHGFLDFKSMNFMHEVGLNDSQARVVESYIAPIDMNLNGQSIKKGSWVMVAKVEDDNLWKQIKSGDITGFSMEGIARAGDEIMKSECGKITKRNLVDLSINAVALVDKGANKRRFYLKKGNEMAEQKPVEKVETPATAAVPDKAALKDAVKEALKEIMAEEAAAKPVEACDTEEKKIAKCLENPEADIPEGLEEKVMDALLAKTN
jgi:hypothetical protein